MTLAERYGRADGQTDSHRKPIRLKGVFMGYYKYTFFMLIFF